MKTASQKTAKVSSWILIIIGGVVLYFAAQNYWYWYQFEQKAIKTEGTIVRFHEGRGGSSRSSDTYPVYTPVFSFIDNVGKQHEVQARASDPDPADRIGDKVMVIYELGKPEEARLYRFLEIYIWAAVLGSIGGICILFAVINLSVFAINKRRIEWLKANGQKVKAEITEIKAVKHKQTFITIFTTYEIKAQWKNPSDGQTYYFSSLKNATNILKDPTPQLGKEVTVFINPNYPQKSYWMDLSFLA